MDYFLVSENVRNYISVSKHNNSYKSDHSIVSLALDLLKHSKGPVYFKTNNSLLLDTYYQNIIKTNSDEITTFDAEANPKSLWELVKNTIRNETIKYASKKKKQTNKLEDKLNNDINKLK